jgi:ssDNA-binding Zn-finger/Zn-ribbon topoisomerase 1
VTDRQTNGCKWVSAQQARVLPRRHADDCPDQDACDGCLPCPERHCGICRRTHADVTCAECVARTRDDLHAIASLCGALPTEVAHRSVNGEAMMLLGPAADPEAWRNRAMSAMVGRVNAAYLEDCRDELHPLWVLGTWDQMWREHLDHPTDLTATLPRLVDYLDSQMGYMADREDPPFDDFAGDLRKCRSHLEDVLSEGVREERGAPCPKCGKGALIKSYGITEAGDRWVCRNSDCREWWTESDYRKRIGAIYEGVADALTASAIHRVYRVPEGTTRAWASGDEPTVRKRGKDANGIQLYDVADVVEQRDRRESA